jgi:hypothetical protein
MTITPNQDRGSAVMQDVGRRVAPVNRAAEKTVHAVGVAGLGVAAVTLAVAPDPTGATKLGAAYFGTRFVDETQAFVRGTESEAHQGARFLAEKALGPEHANFYASAGIGALDTFVGVGAFSSGPKAQPRKPIEGIKQENRTAGAAKPKMEALPTRQPEARQAGTTHGTFRDPSGRLRNADGTFAPEDRVRGDSRPRGPEPPQLARGKRAHKAEPVRPGEIPEHPTPSGRRMDRYDPEKAHIREIKTDNPSELRRGAKTVEEYRREMEKATQRPHTTEVTPYDPKKYEQ